MRSKDYVNLGMVGSGMMGRYHSVAYSTIPVMFDTSIRIKKKVIADANEELAREAAERLDFEEWVASWQDLIGRNDVDVVDIVTPNDLHAPIVCAAAAQKKHVICEKPLALNLEQARAMHEAVSRAGVKHCVSFNYQKTPAVLHTKKMIENGKLGRIFHFRGQYLQDTGINPLTPIGWRHQSSRAGSGSLGDTGSHVISLAHFLLGSIREVTAMSETFITRRPVGDSDGEVDVDDAVSFLCQFEKKALGIFEASRFCTGRKNRFSFEINGSEGAVFFDWERSNELLFCNASAATSEQGFTRTVIGPSHPYGGALQRIPGIGMSYVDTVAIMLYEFLQSLFDRGKPHPDFSDGVAVQAVMEAVQRSASNKCWEKVCY
jgi:predicted dehydrogenase